MYVLTELGYVLICQVKEKRKKKCSFENAPVEKGESSIRNKNGLVEGLLLFSIKISIVIDLKIINEIKQLEAEKIDEPELLHKEIRIIILKNKFLGRPNKIEEKIYFRR